MKNAASRPGHEFRKSSPRPNPTTPLGCAIIGSDGCAMTRICGSAPTRRASFRPARTRRLYIQRCRAKRTRQKPPPSRRRSRVRLPAARRAARRGGRAPGGAEAAAGAENQIQPEPAARAGRQSARRAMDGSQRRAGHGSTGPSQDADLTSRWAMSISATSAGPAKSIDLFPIKPDGPRTDAGNLSTPSEKLQRTIPTAATPSTCGKKRSASYAGRSFPQKRPRT